MILFQQKLDGTASNMPSSGQTRLLEISSNCDWERIRPKVFAQLSNLPSSSVGYPQTCSMSIAGFRVEVQPRPERPTEIPVRLRASLGMSSMFAIRVRITAEEHFLPTAVSNSLAPSVTKLSSKKLNFPNGLNVGPVYSSSADSSIDFTKQNLTSTLARHRMQETNTTDSIQHAMIATTDSSQQKTNIDPSPQSVAVDVSQHALTGLSENTEILRKDESSKTKSVCAEDDRSVQKWPEPVSGVETAAQDCCSTHEDTGLDVNGHFNASSCVDSDNSCGALQQQAEDTAVTISDDSSVGAEYSEPANSSVCDDDRNFLPSADDVNFPSSSDQTAPAASCTEVMCSLPADDGNFPSSSSLSLPIACPLDLRT